MKPKHGANLFELSEKYGFDIDEIVDFSSNINPFGVSPNAIDALKNNLDKASIYPDPNYLELKKIISNYLDCDSNSVILSSGVSGLIKSFVNILKPKNSLIYSPTYSEYEKEIKSIGSKIYKYRLQKEDKFKCNTKKIIEEINDNNIDLVLICNPNNPTGTIMTNDEIEKIAKGISAMLIVDETYVEFSDTKSYSSSKITRTYDNIIVMRSTSKFFSTPGIRLGYAVTNNKELLDTYNNSEELIWGINIYADIMGRAMFEDFDYQKKVQQFVREERDFIYKELSVIDSLKLYESRGNFILMEIIDKSMTADDLYDELIKDKMAIRNCKTFENLDEHFFRICILSRENNRKIITGIKNAFNR